MDESENRKFPRQEVYNRQRVLNMPAPELVDREFVISKNISATGLCVKSSKKYQQDDYIVIRLDARDCADLTLNKARIMKLGNYVLGRVIWCRQSTGGYFEIGVSFLHQSESNEETMAIFTRLLNQDAIDIISQRDLL